MSSLDTRPEFTPSSYQIGHFLTAENVSRLENIMYPQNAPEGSHVFWEGDKAEKLFYIRKGQVKITKSTEDGKELILNILQKGDFFGEFGGYGDMHYGYNGEAIKDSVIGVVQQKDLEILVYQHGDFAVEFMKWMGLMQRTTQSKFRDLMLFGKTGALASTLIRLTNTCGEKNEDGSIKLAIKLTNTDLANMIGTTRESVNRLLSTYKEEGVISYEQGQIIIHDLLYLKSIVNCPNCPPEICRI
ncbi:MAG: Crp/Fnr family transcriptional regulator [Paenibacillaceae bacterium]|jgi:CRP/FNR family transcriptional regulator|nr:Crp/Fnr family transcriptional regulator [Paenibacillaceae bacterium]